MVVADRGVAGVDIDGDAGTNPSRRWFAGRRAAFGTMHGKERVVAPLLREALGIEVLVPSGFDSDRFGTFTRDVPRAGSQLEAARRKALAAMDASGLDLGIASEGSFGPHPAVPFVPADLELVVLVDRANGLEIVGHHVTTEAMFGHASVGAVDEAVAFAKSVGFPDHALVVRRGPDDPRDLAKGVGDETSLRAAVARLLAASSDGRVFVESDLRAHRNPTRMAVIAEATRALVDTVRRCCPACGVPGFEVVERRPGLPCAWCRLPTDLTLALVYACRRCGHRAERGRDDGRDRANSGECPNCNP
ncbi:MAG: hypothetical protein M3Q10_10380 [Chloroflexota bacterium]|nr:hypothetical protein [Chloroflexota bacterium]